MIHLRNAVRLSGMLLDYRLRRETVSALPVRLWIESSSVCNLKCVMCPNKDMPAASKTVMKPELFRKIIAEAKSFANDIYLHHRGEPLINPALFEMIACANAAGLRTRFHTNGALLTAEKAELLLKAAPQLVSFSVDGFDKTSYENVRVGATFETTIANIIRFAGLRRTAGAKHPYIVVETIRFKAAPAAGDASAALLVRNRLKEAGVDEIIEKDEYVWTEESVPERKEARTCTICTFPWYAMVICADGTVTPCPQDFGARLVMGNANTQSLREIWNGQAYTALRKQFNTDISALSLCHKCDRLYRKTVGGVPFQYMVTFLVDQLLGYGKLRRMFGTSERN